MTTPKNEPQPRIAAFVVRSCAGHKLAGIFPNYDLADVFCSKLHDWDFSQHEIVCTAQTSLVAIQEEVKQLAVYQVANIGMFCDQALADAYKCVYGSGPSVVGRDEVMEHEFATLDKLAIYPGNYVDG